MAQQDQDLNLPFPPVSDEFLAALDRAFPLRNPPPDEPHHITQRRAGARDVLMFLRIVAEQQRGPRAED